MTYWMSVTADLILITVLVGTYYRRHRRRDLVLAYLCINVGVLAVTAVLAHATVGAGLGLGLFGVLSIIRLRSEELNQHEIAYYFAALTMGLLAGFGDAGWWPAPLMVLITLVMLIGDHPRMLASHAHQVMLIDRAIADEAALRRRVAEILGAEVVSVSVRRLDLVSDSTLVDVRYRVAPAIEPARIPA
jgi:hypothetical protein